MANYQEIGGDARRSSRFVVVSWSSQPRRPMAGVTSRAAAYGGGHCRFAKDVVVLGSVLREVELRLLEDGDEVGQAIDHCLTFAEFVWVVEAGKVAAGQASVGVDQRLDDLAVDPVADVAFELADQPRTSVFGQKG